MASQAVLKGLRRICKSIPLPALNQGSSLSIRSQVPLTSLNIVSQWRDDGLVDCTQIIRNDDDDDAHREPLNLSVTQLEDRMTSLGRSASHVSIALQRMSSETTDTTAKNNGTNNYAYPTSSHDSEKSVHHVVLDDGSLHPNRDEFVDLKDGQRRVEYHDGIARITTEEDADGASSSSLSSSSPGVHLTVMVPEKVNLDIQLDHKGNINVPGKIEGDVELSASNGAITVKKLRGHKITLESFGENALVNASDLLEAQTLSMNTSGRVRAKQLHCSSIDVRVSHTEDSCTDFEPLDTDDDTALIDVSSIYVAGDGGALLSVQSAHPQNKAIRLKTNHGPIRASVDGVCQPTAVDANTNEIQPLVELGGVNGNFELFTDNTVLRHDNVDWKSCLVHVDSLSPDTVSLLTADAGDINLTIDRKVEADVRLLSAVCTECLVEASSLLAEEEDGGLAMSVVQNMPISPNESSKAQGEPTISIETKAFTERPGGNYKSDHIHYIDGWVENNSAEPPSRFDRKVRGETAVGKINIESAADQALRSFGEKSNESSSDEFPRPLMAVIGTSHITLETVSWLGAIARRYGLDEGGRDLGRTASRKGRLVQPPPRNE